jgi:hypothetical protein
MDDLMKLAGKKVSVSTPVSTKAETVVASGVQKAEAVAKKVAPQFAAVTKRERSRETTPAVEGEGDKPKGWLGSWFGRS